jgi:hypothetical protein
VTRPNLPLLYRTLAHIAARPDRFTPNEHPHSFAAHAARLHQAVPVPGHAGRVVLDQAAATRLCKSDLWLADHGPNPTITVRHYARLALGLTTRQAEDLFAPDATIPGLHTVVGHIVTTETLDQLCDRIERTAHAGHLHLTDDDRAAIALGRNPATEEGADDVFTTSDHRDVDLPVYLRILGDRCHRATARTPARA